jgi:hypothetical protein
MHGPALTAKQTAQNNTHNFNPSTLKIKQHKLHRLTQKFTKQTAPNEFNVTVDDVKIEKKNICIMAINNTIKLFSFTVQ